MNTRTSAALHSHADEAGLSQRNNQKAGPGAIAENANANRADLARLSEAVVDAKALQSRLAEAFDSPNNRAAPVEDQADLMATQAPRRAIRPFEAVTLSRLIKTVAGLALVAVVGWMPLERLLQISSVEALVNARIVTMRAPIEGVIEGPELKVGGDIVRHAPLAVVANPRADRGGLERSEEALMQAAGDRDAATARLAGLLTLRDEVARKLEAFRLSRKHRVAAQLLEADARIASSLAEEERARAALGRATALSGKKLVSKASVEDAVRDMAVAAAAVEEARAAKAVLVIEANALEAGVFFGDGYNDEPRSAQRLDEIRERISGVESDLRRYEAQVDRAAAALDRERSALALARTAPIASPVRGRVWEVLTAPGEQVVAGQELVSLVDCSQLIVTAAVSEAVFNGLGVGTPAEFTFREGGAALSGRVVQLSGVADASSKFAIVPSALTKESYRVAVAIDAPSVEHGCPVGRTGRVVFRPAR